MVKRTGVIEGWTGPGRRDTRIEPLKPVDDGLHIDMGKRGMYEWWYFDAHFDSGHTMVVFFYASNPNPGVAGKIGIEIVLLRPDGVRVQIFNPYKKSDFTALKEKPEVKIGENTLRVEYPEGEFPIYHVTVKEGDLGCDLIYQAEVNGWKPGSGLSQFGELGYFGWVVPFARASVEGTVTDGDATFQVSGIGYHDHNWLNFPFQSIIRYWMWGRIYGEKFTAAYAYIQCNEKVDHHTVKVLMLAEGKEIVLSTGEFDFLMDDFEYNANTHHRFPKQIAIKVRGLLDANLRMKKILEAQSMLDNFNPVFRFIAKNILRIQPGYFRLESGFELTFNQDQSTIKEIGTTLHEIVLFKHVQQEQT